MPSSLLTWCKQTARYFFSNVGFIWDQQRIQLESATMVTHMHGKGRRALIERKRKLGGLLWTESLTFSWLSSCQEQREVCLVVELCCGLRAWQLLDPGFQILFDLKKFHSSECSFSSVRNWATPTYFTVHCLARLPLRNPQHFPVYLIVNCPFMYTHFQQGWRFCYQIKLLFSYFICA